MDYYVLIKGVPISKGPIDYPPKQTRLVIELEWIPTGLNTILEFISHQCYRLDYN
jgi:hypothetical protein